MDNINEQIDKLKNSYTAKQSNAGRDELFNELLDKYAKSLERIIELEEELAELKLQKGSMPSKEDVETMSSMLDLINKLDDETIRKLNRFSGKQ